MYSKEEQRRLYDVSKRLLSQNTEGVSQAEAKTLVADVSAVLRYNEWRYYIMDEPQLSDFEYDTLYKKLESLEDRFPELQADDSPTMRVGSDIAETLDTVPHLTPMLSLENSYNAEDLMDFDAQIRKLAKLGEAEPIEYVVEPKFDGGTIALVYENDVLVDRKSTRLNSSHVLRSRMPSSA